MTEKYLKIVCGKAEYNETTLNKKTSSVTSGAIIIAKRNLRWLRIMKTIEKYQTSVYYWFTEYYWFWMM